MLTDLLVSKDLHADDPLSNRMVDMSGYLDKGIPTPMAPGRSTEIMLMITRILSSRLLMNDPLSPLSKPLYRRHCTEVQPMYRKQPLYRSELDLRIIDVSVTDL